MSEYIILTRILNHDPKYLNFIMSAILSKLSYAIAHKHMFMLTHDTEMASVPPDCKYVWLSSADTLIVNSDIPLSVLLGGKDMVVGHNKDNILLSNKKECWDLLSRSSDSKELSSTTDYFSPYTEFQRGNFCTTFPGMKEGSIIKDFVGKISHGEEKKEVKCAYTSHIDPCSIGQYETFRCTKWKWIEDGKRETGFLEFLPEGKAVNTWGPATWKVNSDGSYLLTQGACQHTIYFDVDGLSFNLLRQDGYFATGIPFHEVKEEPCVLKPGELLAMIQKM